MKLEDSLEGNCKHGIPKREVCHKCWEKMAKDSKKITEKFLKNLDRAEKLARKSKLMIG